MARESIVAFPFVSKDGSSRSHVLLDQPNEGVMISPVLRTFHQEALPSCPAVPTKHPLAHHTPSSVVFSLSKLGFVNFYDVTLPANLLSRLVFKYVFRHALSKCLVEGSHCLRIHGEDSCSISHTHSVTEYPEKVEEFREGNAPVVEDTSSSNREAVSSSSAGPAASIDVV